MKFNLDGRQFRPVKNSAEGRVTSNAIFTFTQNAKNFRADYAGEGFSDGHLIGSFINQKEAKLIYHSRADDGSLEAGQADAFFSLTDVGELKIKMKWQWLNGTGASGTSEYVEISRTP